MFITQLLLQTAAVHNSTISTLCGGGVNTRECTTALGALTRNTACTSMTDADTTICTGTCRDLYDDVIDKCDTTVSDIAIRVDTYIYVASYLANYTV